MEDTNNKIETLHTWNTDYCADSVEWCPIESYEKIFVCGTYQLNKDDTEGSSVRIGRIYLFDFDIAAKELHPEQMIETAGVLDQKWCNHLINNTPTLAVVTASGSLQIYSLLRTGNGIKLEIIAKSTVGESVIATSLDWSNNDNNNPNLLVTDTNGNVTLFLYCSDNKEINIIKTWKAHDYEAWICSFDSWNPHIVFTGGDDCKLKMFDIRLDTKSQNTINRSCGVTSLHFNKLEEFKFSSGSYDEIMCLWDTRMLKKTISEINLGGGIWRLKWEPKKSKLILAACMLNGFSIIDCHNLESPKLLIKYEDHQSLAYGSDWCHAAELVDPNDNFSNLIGTCSFYDCKMNLARIKL